MLNLTMMNTPNLEKVIAVYFALKKNDREPYTIPGLALACGFSKTGDILSTLKEAEGGDSPYPETSIKALTRAVTRIEEHCLINGLQNKFSAPLAKFCLGAYHNVKDTNEALNVGVTQISVVFSDDTQPQLQRMKNVTPMPLSITFDNEVDSLLAAL